MAKWNLIDKSQKVGKETVYHYVCEGSNSNGVKFHSHPTIPFGVVVVEGSKNVASYVAEAMMIAGTMQHKYPGGFDEAIQTLNV